MMNTPHHHQLKTQDGMSINYTTNFLPHELSHIEKPVLIFNYGLVCSNEHWSQQIPYFDKKGYPIIIHDYRGHFESSSAADLSDCNFINFTQDIAEILKELHIKKVIMIGHSMGVNVSLEFAKHYKEFLIAMVLISGTIIPPQDTMFDSQITELIFPLLKLTEQSFPSLFKQIWKANTENPIAHQLILRNGFNANKVPVDFVVSYLEKINRLGPKLFIKLFDDMNKHNLISYLDEINIPTLVIGGEKDKVIPNHFQDIICKKLPRSEFYMVKDGSHVPQMDFPEFVNERMDFFIKQQIKKWSLHGKEA